LPSHSVDTSEVSLSLATERRAAAIVLSDGWRDRFAGLDLVERARLALGKAGIRDIQTRVHGVGPFERLAAADVVVLLPDRTIAQSKAIAALVREVTPDNGGVAVYEDGDPEEPVLVALSAGATEEIRAARTMREVMAILGPGRLKRIDPAPCFCRRIHDRRDIPRLERAFLTHLNGGDTEGFFTRNIRILSVPLTRRFLTWPITANQVTMAGFGFSLLAGSAFWFHSYWTDILGALCYWTSMVLDCSDGEVARAKFSESDFGARLETMADHLSYFVVIGGILWGDLLTEGYDHHTSASIVAIVTSVAMVLLFERMKKRLACPNPAAFNETATAALQQGALVHQIAAWGIQFIKRSFVAHLIVFMALIGHIPALTEVWAWGTSISLALLLAVQMRVLRSRHVESHRPAAAASPLET
jgi:phosphatidylglycerophosphate synthase